MPEALNELNQFYARQHQDVLIRLGVSQLNGYLADVFDGEAKVADLQGLGMPDGLIKTAIDLKTMGHDGVPGLDDLTRIYSDIYWDAQRAVLSVSDDFIQAAVTGDDLSIDDGHVRAQRLWSRAVSYLWQGCDISFDFAGIAQSDVKPLRISAVELDSKAVAKKIEAAVSDGAEIIVDEIYAACVTWGINLSDAKGVMRLAHKLAEHEAAYECNFICRMGRLFNAITIFDEDGIYLNPVIINCLKEWGYSPEHIEEIRLHVLGVRVLSDRMRGQLMSLGLSDDAIVDIEGLIPTANSLADILTEWTTGHDNLHKKCALSSLEWDIENLYTFGYGDITSAPHIAPKHAAILCPSEMAPRAELAILSMIENGIGGRVEADISVPHGITVRALEQLILKAWSLGLSRIRFMRENSGWDAPVLWSNMHKIDVEPTTEAKKEEVS